MPVLSEIASGSPPAPFRCGRKKLPASVSFRRDFGVGGREAVEGTVLEAEETQCLLDAWAVAA